jgi:hypothetical protein
MRKIEFVITRMSTESGQLWKEVCGRMLPDSKGGLRKFFFYRFVSHAFICIYLCVCVCVYIYIYTYMYIYTHT